MEHLDRRRINYNDDEKITAAFSFTIDFFVIGF